MCNGMQLNLRLAAVTLFTAALFSCAPGFAQAPAAFKVRLSPVAMDIAMRANIAGSGTATATLQGTKLTIAG